jgi:hypothetical protein
MSEAWSRQFLNTLRNKRVAFIFTKQRESYVEVLSVCFCITQHQGLNSWTNFLKIGLCWATTIFQPYSFIIRASIRTPINGLSVYPINFSIDFVEI